MTAAKYKSERQRRGSQEKVAALLGVSRQSIARRETGAQVITREAALALCSLPLPKNPKRPKKGHNTEVQPTPAETSNNTYDER